MLQSGADNIASLKEEQSHEGTKEFRTRQAVVGCCHWKVGPLPPGIEESLEGRPIIVFQMFVNSFPVDVKIQTRTLHLVRVRIAPNS